MLWQRIAEHYRISVLEAEHLPMVLITRAEAYLEAEAELSRELDDDPNWPPKPKDSM